MKKNRKTHNKGIRPNILFLKKLFNSENTEIQHEVGDVSVEFSLNHSQRCIVTKNVRGACSYLLKGTPLKKIKEAVETFSRGGSFMTPSIARKVIKHFNPVQKKERNLTPRQQQIV